MNMKPLTGKELEIIKENLELLKEKVSDLKRLENIDYILYRIEDIINSQ